VLRLSTSVIYWHDDALKLVLYLLALSHLSVSQHCCNEYIFGDDGNNYNCDDDDEF